jgi:hypothetical protein
MTLLTRAEGVPMKQLLEKWREFVGEANTCGPSDVAEAVKECADELEAALADVARLQTTDPAVIACMGSVPVCAANGCQFGKTAGYRAGEGPDFAIGPIGPDGTVAPVRKDV